MCADEQRVEGADLRMTQIMKGYLNRPDATAESIDQDGWFKTGDVAIVDAKGNFSIVDRKKGELCVGDNEN